MSIVLVGAPGSGKTTVGALLAAQLGKEFIDVDTRIEQVVGKPIAEIFADDGEPWFRELETAATLELIAQDAVVATGGGAVTSEQLRAAFEPHQVVWLQASIQQATRRIGMNRVRPLLLGNVRARLVSLLRERAPLYDSVCDVAVDTDNKSPQQVADAVQEALGQL
ncbi:MAG: shikimate kinase [Arachnia propionica]|nr:MAG: shikimate kinase [Arachnia propionica]